MNKKEAKKIFGNNIRKLRTARGITQEEFSVRLGYSSRSSINKIESGERDLPRSKIALAASILGVSPLDLFSEEEIEADIIMTETDNELFLEYSKLTDKNKEKLSVYLQALLDSQEE